MALILRYPAVVPKAYETKQQQPPLTQHSQAGGVCSNPAKKHGRC